MGDHRDAQRARVYAAEEAAFAGTLAGEPLPWAQLERYLGDVHRALTRAGVPPGPVQLRRARLDAGHSSARCAPGGGGEIRVAPGHEAPATATHELAHLLAPGDGHGPGFRAAHVAVAAVAFGARGVAVLGEAYAAAGLPTDAPGTPRVPALGGWGLLEALLSGARPMGGPGGEPDPARPGGTLS